MARTFYYDDVGLLSVSIGAADDDGYVKSDGIWDPDIYTSTTGNETALNDNRITGNPATFTQATADGSTYKSGVRFDIGSAQSVDFMAVHVESINSNVYAHLYGSFSSAGSGYADKSGALSLSVGWNVIEFGSTLNRYYVFQLERASALSSESINEVIIGAKYQLVNALKAGGRIGKVFGIEENISVGGEQWAIKRHDGKKRWQRTLSGLTTAQRTTLESVRDAIEPPHYKFLYKDDSGNYWYVKMEKGSLEFQNIGNSLWSTDYVLIEQLS